VGHRDTVLSRCRHFFCRGCIDGLVKVRNRKCPSCKLAFTDGELLTVFYGAGEG